MKRETMTRILATNHSNGACFRKLSFCALPLLCLFMGFAVSAAEMTAFQLIKEGNRYVGEQAKDKVVQIRSEKSVGGSLTPNIWYVVFYDSTATLNATEVKFGSGKMLAVTRPLRLLEPVSGGDLPLDRQKMKVDSDAVIKSAQKEPMVQNLKLLAAKLKLERVGEGLLGQSGAGQPVWKVELWAGKARQPSKDVEIGELWYSASDGKQLKNDLHVDRVN
jgi:hypothetical protein